MKPPTLLFLIGEDWYFWMHRLDLARAARDKGFSVIVATRVHDHALKIESEGFVLWPIGLVRGNKNPVKEFNSIVELIRLYRSEMPDIVHHIGIKPLVYGAWAARFARVPAMVSMFAGLGYVFSQNHLRARLIQRVVGQVLRMSLSHPNSRVIFQNEDDRDQLVFGGIVPAHRARLIRGSGVDISMFVPEPEPEGLPVVVLASRMLWNKGVGEFVEAARIMKQRGVEVRCALMGMVDMDNPVGIPEKQLTAWHDEGVVEWWGFREDMVRVFAQAHIVTLPSYYGEGIPKVLIEAASSGRPIIATQERGCREIVHDGENGLLVPSRSPEALAEAISTLVAAPELRKKMGARGRQMVVEGFSKEKVAQETLALYQELLGQSS